MVSYGSRRSYTPEVLEQLKQIALERKQQREAQDIEDASYNQFVDPGSAFGAGFALDFPGQVYSGFEDYTYGPGITSSLIKNKSRSREGSKNVIDRTVTGIKEGRESLVRTVPDGPPNRFLYVDEILGEYVNPAGETVYVDKEMRNAMRDSIRDKSSYYRAGENTMLAVDATAIPAIVTGVIKYTPKILGFVGKTVPKYLLDTFPKTTAAAISLAVSSSGTEAEAKTVSKLREEGTIQDFRVTKTTETKYLAVI